MKGLVQTALEVVRQNRRAYITVNLVFYGLVIAGALAVMLFPEVQQTLLSRIREGLRHGGLKAVADAYRKGHVLTAIPLTFVLNLVVGAFVSITLPSLILPFSGFLLGVFRALVWGLALSPADPQLRYAMIPHSVTLLIEGQGYVLALLAAYIQGKALFRPATGAESTLSSRYLSGLKSTVAIYLLVVVVIAVAAVYEALEVIYIAPLLTSP